MKLKRTMAALAAAVAALTSVTFATPAHAASGWNVVIATQDDNPGGRLWFAKVGDVVQVCDTQADGKSAEAYVYNASGSLRYKFNASTSGTCVTKNAAMEGIYDLDEGASYKLEVCLLTNGASPAFCQYVWTTA